MILFCCLLLSIHAVVMPVKQEFASPIAHYAMLLNLDSEKRNQNLGDRKENTNMSKKTRTSYRSAITGRFINKTTAKRHPKTTVKETNKVKPKRKSK